MIEIESGKRAEWGKARAIKSKGEGGSGPRAF